MVEIVCQNAYEIESSCKNLEVTHISEISDWRLYERVRSIPICDLNDH